MRFKLHKFSILLVLFLIISVGFNIAAALSDGTEPEAGSEQDPLISKSYVDYEVAQLKQQLEELKNQQQTGGSEGFAVLTLESGQTLLPGGGTEIILRNGKATAVSGQNGDNLADVTSAKDLAKGASIVLNHLLISSRDDGRGLKAAAKCYLLVRGAYKINDPQQAESSVEQSPQETTGSQGGDGNTPAETEPSNTGDENGESGTPTETEPSDNGGNNTPTENESTEGKITASVLNVRSEPNTSAQILAKVFKGDTVTVLSSEGDWLKIRTSAGVEGYVLGMYVEM